MIRENRFIVLKRSDVDNALTHTEKHILDSLIDRITEYRYLERKQPCPKFVCVRSTWPMYEETWESIEKYVDGLE